MLSSVCSRRRCHARGSACARALRRSGALDEQRLPVGRLNEPAPTACAASKLPPSRTQRRSTPTRSERPSATSARGASPGRTELATARLTASAWSTSIATVAIVVAESLAAAAPPSSSARSICFTLTASIVPSASTIAVAALSTSPAPVASSIVAARQAAPLCRLAALSSPSTDSAPRLAPTTMLTACARCTTRTGSTPSVAASRVASMPERSSRSTARSPAVLVGEASAVSPLTVEPSAMMICSSEISSSSATDCSSRCTACSRTAPRSAASTSSVELAEARSPRLS